MRWTEEQALAEGLSIVEIGEPRSRFGVQEDVLALAIDAGATKKQIRSKRPDEDETSDLTILPVR